MNKRIKKKRKFSLSKDISFINEIGIIDDYNFTRHSFMSIETRDMPIIMDGMKMPMFFISIYDELRYPARKIIPIPIRVCGTRVSKRSFRREWNVLMKQIHNTLKRNHLTPDSITFGILK